ncbi:MAG: hypothetical protein EWM51_08775 [Treponema sp.]|nr:MAG: hypothetical protein EWM51_08775 [Treponema sp.]
MTIATDPRAQIKANLARLLPYVRFLKVKDYESTTYFEQCDTPKFEPDQTFYNSLDGKTYKVLTILLSMKSFPRVLASMTAMEAGAYALDRCLREKWTVTEDNLRSVLVHLEMEM